MSNNDAMIQVHSAEEAEVERVLRRCLGVERADGAIALGVLFEIIDTRNEDAYAEQFFASSASPPGEDGFPFAPSISVFLAGRAEALFGVAEFLGERLARELSRSLRKTTVLSFSNGNIPVAVFENGICTQSRPTVFDGRGDFPWKLVL